MLGVVLCGGKSTRMGRDKGLLKPESETWARIAANKLNALKIPVRISINSNQYKGYSTIFPSADFIPDNENLGIRGPLVGVLSAHLQHPYEDILVLACDMPMMESFLLDKLIQSYRSQPLPMAFLYINDTEPEPLCGIYKSDGLARILEMLQNGQMPKVSMKSTLSQLDILAIPIKNEEKKYFRNFNTLAELAL